MTRERAVDEVCGIAQAASVMGDWWNLLVVREVVRGRRRFDELVTELRVSRKVSPNAWAT
jgi:DNA-binding HxlR family transcriptional regulator